VGFFSNTGDYITVSDKRLKNDIRQLSPVLNEVMQLQPVQYKMKHNNSSGRISIGFIAQDVRELFPGLVHSIMDSASGKDDNNLYAVNYTGFSVLAIKAVQELKVENEELKKQVETLKAEITLISNEQQKLIELLQTRMEAAENRSKTVSGGTEKK
jgi:Chaperone of endosialidase